MLPTRYVWSIPLWLCYVDDTVTAVHKDEIDDFHEHLNRQKVDIQFSKGFTSVVTFVEGEMVAFAPKRKQGNERQVQVVLYHRDLK